MFWVWACSLSYPSCNAHAPYCHLWPLRLYDIFPHYVINGEIFGQILPNMKCVFWFCPQFWLKHFSFWKELSAILSYIYIRLHVRCLLLLSDLNESWIYGHIFEKKNSNVISSENPSSWNRVVPCGQAYRQAGRRKDRCSDMKKLIVAFRNFADTSEKRQGLQYRSLNLFIAATFLSVCLSVYNHYHQWLPNSAELNQPQIRIANCLQL